MVSFMTDTAARVAFVALGQHHCSQVNTAGASQRFRQDINSGVKTAGGRRGKKMTQESLRLKSEMLAAK
jgi:hypothetical protein